MEFCLSANLYKSMFYIWKNFKNDAKTQDRNNFEDFSFSGFTVAEMFSDVGVCIM